MYGTADGARPEIVRVTGLTKQVATGDAQLTILADVSFGVASGEAVAIIGVSGSGKSTLLGLLAGLDTPSAGDVLIDGHSLYALDEDGRAALRARIRPGIASVESTPISPTTKSMSMSVKPF